MNHQKCHRLGCTDRARWLVWVWTIGLAPAPIDTAEVLYVCGLHAKCWPFDHWLPFSHQRWNPGA